MADTVSDRFAANDSDVTFRSCDGILFRVHRKNLDTSSEGFSPPDGTSSQDEIVPLTEDGATLDLLFQYIYPQPVPDLTKIGFKQLAGLAEAAEKYQVYAAIGFCQIRMSEAYSEHPFEVMMYAFRHGHGEIMDKAHNKALELSPTLAFESFTPQVYIAWTRYYAQWLDLLVNFHKHIDKVRHHTHCDRENKWFISVVSQSNTPASLLNFGHTFEVAQTAATDIRSYYNSPPSCCSICMEHIKDWMSGMPQSIERMKKLSSFL
ncbi:hypothetical protein FIBSPDRAFT_852012 [Athelia psychrophila]|uniref:BTB domain-containing protein n=1 Tax=Athelia psychrophila TaxID=1759441 RepID=A0A166S9B4_9AGAM|nr:hypothetical protein FIBSPDRAFT_852012 [Fibularhizoctonia sp. CBS 109695]